MKRITDLDAFCLSEIVRPYAPLLSITKRPETLTFALNDLVEMLEAGDEWADLVLNRLSGLRFWFPHYVQHPIVTLIVKNQSRKKE